MTNLAKSSQISLLGQESNATFSECGRYRYTLTRTWGDPAPAVLFVMLNPSTADADVDDPTIRRCIGFARRWGYDTLHVGNLFAYRATDPRLLGKIDAPVGPDNDDWLEQLAAQSRIVVCAWGADPAAERRGTEVAEQLRRLRSPLWALGLTKDGHPRHPLYVKGDATLIRFEEAS